MRSRKQKVVAVLILAVTVLTLLLGAVSSVANAHAVPLGADPANGAALRSSPVRVSVRFNEPVTTSVSRFQLLGRTGKPVKTSWSEEENGAVQVLVPSRPLPVGAYAVRWSVTSADGHVVTGASSFVVKEKNARKKNQPLTFKQGARSVKGTLGSDRSGRMTFTAPEGAFTSVEFTNRALGSTLRYPLTTRKATVVLPLKGSWTVTLIEKPSEYSELRWSGSTRLG